METREWNILSKEDQLSILGGRWVVIDGELIWIKEVDFDNVENTL